METILNEVGIFATKAHSGQTRKYSPEPYIVHPIRVMQKLKAANMPLPLLAAALLHDVIEDTHISKLQLSEFLYSIMSDTDAEETIKLVVELTDVYVKSAYPQYNRHKRKDLELQRIILTSPSAQTVKYADILDNVKEITSSDPDFAPRYLRECLAILRKIDKGDENLLKAAIDAVESGLNSLK